MLVHNHLSTPLTNQLQLVKKEFSLPDDIINEIFKFLSAKDCCNTARVNRCFRKLSLENSNYLYNLECSLLDLCIDRGIRHKKIIREADYSSKSISKDHQTAKLHTEEINKVKEDDSTPKLLLTGVFECKAKTGNTSRRKMIEFKLFNSCKLVFKDPENHLFNHELPVSEYCYHSITEIYTAQQISSILCLKCKRDGIAHKFSIFLDLERYIKYLIFPWEKFTYNGFVNPFVERSFLVKFQETWNRIIDQNHMIIYGKNQIHLFKLNKNMLFERIWSQSDRIEIFEIDLDSLYMNDMILFFVGSTYSSRGIHIGHIFNLERCLRYIPYVYRDFSLISLHNKIAIIKEYNTLLFLHKFNPVTGVHNEETINPKRLIVNGEIKNVTIDYSADQLIVKVLYQKAATRFQRSKLKELTLSSKNLEPQVCNQKRKNPFKFGCSSV